MSEEQIFKMCDQCPLAKAKIKELLNYSESIFDAACDWQNWVLKCYNKEHTTCEYLNKKEDT